MFFGIFLWFYFLFLPHHLFLKRKKKPTQNKKKRKGNFIINAVWKKSQPRLLSCSYLRLRRSQFCSFQFTPLPTGEKFQMLIFFLFENINNDYFVLCGISRLLFHPSDLSVGSEFLKGFWRPRLILQLAEIWFEISEQRGLTASPWSQASLVSHRQLPVPCPSWVHHSPHSTAGQTPASAEAGSESGLSGPDVF